LTVLNAVVFFVVLVAIGSIVYVQLRAQIYDKLDAALIAATKQLAPSSELSYRYEQQKSAPAGSGGLASAPADHTDRPVAGRSPLPGRPVRSPTRVTGRARPDGRHGR